MLTHSFLTRDAEVSGRTLTLACVPYDTPTPVADGGDPYVEQFTRGAFRKAVKAPHLVELLYRHRPGVAYGFAHELREDADYLIGSWRVAGSDEGDKLLGLVRDDQLRGVSVGFVPGDKPEDNQMVDGVLTRAFVKHLGEVSLVPDPAYPQAQVLALRHAAERNATREREFWQWVRYSHR